MATAAAAPVLLHAHGVELTFTPNGVYVIAPAQRVQAHSFQPPAEWPMLPKLQVFWPWQLLRMMFQIEDRAAKAEARRLRLKRQGVSIKNTREGSTLVRLGMRLALDDVDLSQPVVPEWPKSADPMMIAWLGRVRERALRDEPVRVEYGPDAKAAGLYSTRLVGAWTGLHRRDLRRTCEGSTCDRLEDARAEAVQIEVRLRRAGRMPVLFAADAA